MNTELEDFFNGLCCTQPTNYNFDITADWIGQDVTNKVNFISFMEGNGLSNITVDDFSLSENRLQCNLSASVVEQYALDGLNVTQLNKIGNIIDENFEYMYFYNNNFIYDPKVVIKASKLIIQNNNTPYSFNPTLPLYEQTTTLQIINDSINGFNPTLPLPSNLMYLELDNNSNLSSSTFCNTNSLPITLTSIKLNNCSFTLADYSNLESWANAQPSFTNTCIVNLEANIDSVSGTNLESILISKNCNVIA
jgi:hypothetical protein